MEEGWGNPFITIVNRSDKTVNFIINEQYPDSSVFNWGHTTLVGPNDQIDYTYYLSRKELFKKHPVMQVFAITWADCDLPNDTIIKYHLYKRYELTKQKLEKDNWTIVYPPEN